MQSIAVSESLEQTRGKRVLEASLRRRAVLRGSIRMIRAKGLSTRQSRIELTDGSGSQRGPQTVANPGAVVVIAEVHRDRLGPVIPRSFVGFSTEFGGLSAEHYFLKPSVDFDGVTLSPNPIVAQLFNNLSIFQGPPVLRLGGNSTDKSVWQTEFLPTTTAPSSILVTRRWLEATRALVDLTHSSLIIGLNLAVNEPNLAVEWAKAASQYVGLENIRAFEIGNEPNYFLKHGLRSAPFGFSEYTRQFKNYIGALRSWNPRIPLAGPVTSDAAPRYLSEESWAQHLPTFLCEIGRCLDLVTYHRYPLHRCRLDPQSPRYPTVTQLLSSRASGMLGREALTYVNEAGHYGLPVRVSEINSVACGGADSLSNTMASALWAIDTLFHLARAGISGANFHVGGHKAVYAPFRVTAPVNGDVVSTVYPLYYGLLFFAQAIQHEARLTQVITSGFKPIKVWATYNVRGVVHVAIINKTAELGAKVVIDIPGVSKPGRLIYLAAPNITATAGLTLAGQTYDDSRDGRPQGPYIFHEVVPQRGRFVFHLPAACAALLVVRT